MLHFRSIFASNLNGSLRSSKLRLSIFVTILNGSLRSLKLRSSESISLEFTVVNCIQIEMD